MAPIEPRMDTNTIFSWNGFTVFQELHWQRHLRFLWNTATCEGSTPTCYSSLSHRPPIPFPTLYCPLKGHAATLPCWRARARQPRTPPSPLFPTLYCHCLLMNTRRKRRVGAPERASHALSSSPSSLLPTLQARPSAPATHSSLPSSPYPLLETCIHGIPCAVSSLTASPCSSRSFLASVKSFISLAARSTALP